MLPSVVVNKGVQISTQKNKDTHECLNKEKKLKKINNTHKIIIKRHKEKKTAKTPTPICRHQTNEQHFSLTATVAAVAVLGRGHWGGGHRPPQCCSRPSPQFPGHR